MFIFLGKKFKNCGKSYVIDDFLNDIWIFGEKKNRNWESLFYNRGEKW